MLSLSNNACNVHKCLCYLHVNIIWDSSKSETHSVNSVHVDYVEYCLINVVSMLSLSNNACNVLKSLGYLHINIIWDSSKSESHSVNSVHVHYVEYCLIKTVCFYAFIVYLRQLYV